MTKKKANSGGKAAASPDFEESLAQIAHLIDKLEQGDLNLADSLTAFEESLKLTRAAQKSLSDAEQKVLSLVEVDGEPAALHFDEPEAG